MDYEKLKNAVKKIEMPHEMKERVIKNCQSKALYGTEESMMRKNKTNGWFKKPILAAAVVSLCLCAALAAAAGTRFGFFRDITNWKGTVVGTRYEQASDEIKAEAILGEKEIIVCAEMLEPDKIPYSEMETFGIDEYKIVDASGKAVVEGERTDFFDIVEGKAEVKIPLDGIASGEYRILITAFVGGKKADQPLRVSGNWECAFSV